MTPPVEGRQTHLSPTHVECLDDATRALWEEMRTLPADLRLYGGTALALYLGHRRSVDFDLATPARRRRREPHHADPLARRRDAARRPRHDRRDRAQRPRRPGDVHGKPAPWFPTRWRSRSPPPNGVRVAHPADLVRAKISRPACRATRRATPVDPRRLRAQVAPALTAHAIDPARKDEPPHPAVDGRRAARPASGRPLRARRRAGTGTDAPRARR